MITIDGLPLVLSQIEKERGITKDVIIDALKLAFLSACKKMFEEEVWEELTAELDEETGHLTVLHKKKDVTPENFGRLAAQTAKQVILQRIREAEKTSIYDEFSEKIGAILTGTVQRIEGRNYLINLGRIEAILRYSEQIHKEKYNPKDKIRVYIVGTSQSAKGPVLNISRTHPGLLRCLMEMEIPEIHDEIIEIKSVSREPGIRAKVAVLSNDPDVGAVGTCVGHMGQRIQSVVKEMSDERIDVIEWSDDPKVLIGNALKPAKVSQVRLNEAEHTATVGVPEDQLSLAIGKGGQNIRLASRLTGWRLDVVDDQQLARESTKKLSLKEKMALAKARKQAEDQGESSTESPSEAATTETKIKISQLAKDLGVSNKEVLAAAAELDISAKAHNSSISGEETDQLRAHFSGNQKD